MSEPQRQFSLAEILESIADPVVAFDKSFRYTFVSRRAAEMLGRGVEELLGRDMWELFPEDRDTGFREACEQSWREARPVTTERYSKVLGAWVENYIYPLADGATAQWRDITNRKRESEMLLASQRRNRYLADLLDRAGQPFASGYPDGRLGLFNPAFEQLTGYTGHELESIDWAAVLTPPEWLDHERAQLAELERTGQPVRYEKEYIRKDGTRIPIELLAHVAVDDLGQKIYYSFLTDLTDRKRAEKIVREQREWLRVTLNSIGDAVLATDSQGHVSFLNPVAERLCGWSEQEAMASRPARSSTSSTK